MNNEIIGKKLIIIKIIVKINNFCKIYFASAFISIIKYLE